MNIIGFTGRMYSGKSTAAGLALGILNAENGAPAIKLAFADEVKKVAREQFGWDGQKDERGRRLLQVIGTECGRVYDPSIWVKKLDSKVHAAVLQYGVNVNIAIDDLRFVHPDIPVEKPTNERDYIESLGGIVIGLLRHDELTDAKSANTRHPSEPTADMISELPHCLFNGKDSEDRFRRQLYFELRAAGLVTKPEEDVLAA